MRSAAVIASIHYINLFGALKGIDRLEGEVALAARIGIVLYAFSDCSNTHAT